MEDGLVKIAGFVPIKMRSVRLPGKNTIDLAGHPLCAYSLSTLSMVSRLDSVSVFCSTSQIMDFVSAPVDFVSRDPSLDGDEVKSTEVYRAFAQTIKADYYLLVHATSPFISMKTLDDAIDAVEHNVYDSAFTANLVRSFCWFQGKPINHDPSAIAPTQELEPMIVENSAAYIYSRSCILDHSRRVGLNPLVLPLEHPENIDIDVVEDLEMARKFADMLPGVI